MVRSIGAQALVLLCQRESGEVVAELFDSVAIDLLRGVFALIAVFGERFHPWAFRVAIFVAAPGSGELVIDVDDDVGFGGAGSALVGREDTRGGCLHGARFGFGEETQRDVHYAILRLQSRHFTGEAVYEQAAEALRGYGKKFSSFHASAPACLK